MEAIHLSPWQAVSFKNETSKNKKVSDDRSCVVQIDPNPEDENDESKDHRGGEPYYEDIQDPCFPIQIRKQTEGVNDANDEEAANVAAAGTAVGWTNFHDPVSTKETLFELRRSVVVLLSSYFLPPP